MSLSRSTVRDTANDLRNEEGRMKRLWVASVMAGALMVAPACAQAADPPPGAAISPNLEYITRVPEAMA